ncbi:hypothetical protein SteCoe_22748 [Stentor coeruleus]|uniref:Uncharacterized protein n=1 Tax=Stentor coeruleus TaxID=5963 RepID=A0A1R2BLB9_9CILI|nr:hypothetical protein SteCoe_22748 [Stentor coeruleus]
MENTLCAVSGCENPGTRRCDKNKHYNIILCRIHFKAHYADCLYQRECPFKKDIRNIEGAKYFPINIIDSIKIGSYQKKFHHFTIKTSNTDFTEATLSVPKKKSENPNVFVVQPLETILEIKSYKYTKLITILTSQQDSNIPILCEKYINSLKKIISNLESDTENIIEKVKGSFKNYFSALETNRMESLNRFLENVEKVLGMPQEAKKNLFKKVTLADEKTKFLMRYLMKDSVEKNNFIMDFYSSFKPFIKIEHPNIDFYFDMLDNELLKCNLECAEVFEREVNTFFQIVWRKVTYQKVDIEMKELGGKNEVISLLGEWKTIFSFIQAECQMVLHSVTELSDKDLMIVACQGSYHYFIHFNGEAGKLLQIFQADILQVASGSTLSSIVISHYPKNSCGLYSIENSKLIKKYSINLGLSDHEIISHIVYTPELNKVVFIAGGSQLNSLVFQQNRVKIPLKTNNEQFTDMKFIKEKRFVVIKTESTFKIFNDYLVLINEGNILGEKIVVYEDEGKVKFYSQFNDSLIITKIK